MSKAVGPKGVLRRAGSAVKGKEGLAATPVGERRTLVLRGPTGSFVATGCFWWRGLLAVGDRLQPQELRDTEVGKPSWALQDTAHPPGC